MTGFILFILGGVSGYMIEKKREEPTIQAATAIIEQNSEGSDYVLYRDPWGNIYVCHPEGYCMQSY